MTTWKIEDRDGGRKIVPEIPLLSGPDLIRLMRRNRVTMPQLAKRLSMSQDRIRQRKRTGLYTAAVTRDWVQAITGTDPGEIGPGWSVSSLLPSPANRKSRRKSAKTNGNSTPAPAVTPSDTTDN
ncbi:MAG: hypothetical protein ACK5AN_18770 [Planctomyces sp.]